MVFGNVAVHKRTVHTTLDGKRLLLLHGDEFDGVIRYSKFIAHLGDYAYGVLLKLNRYVNTMRRRLGLP